MTDRYTTDLRPYAPRSWPGARFVEFFQVDPPRHRVTELWLSHTDVPGDGEPVRYLSVGTHDLSSWADDDSLGRFLAEQAAIKLMDLAMPDPDVARPVGLGRRLIGHAQQQVTRWSAWPVCRIRVGGAPVEGRCATFAGRTAGVFPDGSSRPRITVIAANVDVPGLDLVRLDDTAPYGLAQPFDRSVMRGAVLPRSRSFHPDFAEFL